MTRSKTYLFGATITVLTVILVTASILHASHPRFSWNIFNTGAALTMNNSRIHVTGTGTFEVKPGNPHEIGRGSCRERV